MPARSRSRRRAFVGIGAYTHGDPDDGRLCRFVAALPRRHRALLRRSAWLLGFPALRVQHHYLAFVTLAFRRCVFLVFRNEEWLTGGIFGLADIPRPSLFGFDAAPTARFYYFVPRRRSASCRFAAWWLVRSPWGRAFMALRENPIRADSLGVDIAALHAARLRHRLGLGGVAGALYAPLVEFIDPTPFTLAPLAATPADGGRRRRRLLLRPVPRRG